MSKMPRCPICGKRKYVMYERMHRSGLGVIGEATGTATRFIEAGNGALAGKAISSMIPSISTVAGGVVGAIAGFVVGTAARKHAEKYIDRSTSQHYYCTQCDHRWSKF